MSRFIKIGEAAKLLGISIQTLRRWEETGYLLPAKKSKGNTRYYDLDQLLGKEKIETVTVHTFLFGKVEYHGQVHTRGNEERTGGESGLVT